MYSQTFDPAAVNWKNVTLGNGNVSVTIGGTPSGPLNGTIDAAGLLFQFYGGGGTINFNGFAIQANGVSGDNLIGGINVSAVSNGSATLSWVGNPQVHLQTTPQLKPTAWTDVPNTVGAHSLIISTTGAKQFFRLVGPSVP